MNRPQQYLLAASLSAIMGADLASGGTAQALERRVDATICSTDGSGASKIYYSAGRYHSEAYNTYSLFCAMPDDSYFPKTSVTTLNVHGYDGTTTNYIAAWACVTYWGTSGGACGYGAYSSTAGTGNVTLNPGRAYWGASNAYDFPYVWVDLPPKDGTSVSKLRGFYLAG